MPTIHHFLDMLRPFSNDVIQTLQVMTTVLAGVILVRLLTFIFSPAEWIRKIVVFLFTLFLFLPLFVVLLSIVAWNQQYTLLAGLLTLGTSLGLRAADSRRVQLGKAMLALMALESYGSDLCEFRKCFDKRKAEVEKFTTELWPRVRPIGYPFSDAFAPDFDSLCFLFERQFRTRKYERIFMKIVNMRDQHSSLQFLVKPYIDLCERAYDKLAAKGIGDINSSNLTAVKTAIGNQLCADLDSYLRAIDEFWKQQTDDEEKIKTKKDNFAGAADDLRKLIEKKFGYKPL